MTRPLFPIASRTPLRLLPQPAIRARSISKSTAQHATRCSLRLGQEACSACQGSELQACYNCDGQGSYKTYGVSVVCKGCKGSGNILCRSCFKGDPWDIEAARTRAEDRRKASLLGFRKQTPPDAPDGILQ